MQAALQLVMAQSLHLAAATAATLLPAWHVLRHTDCAAFSNNYTVDWGVSFEACVAKAGVAAGGFMYTNERWDPHGSNPGCAVGLAPCTHPGTAGNYGNWDSYYCEAAQCAAPVAPPEPVPPTPCQDITAQANCSASGGRCVWESNHCIDTPLSPSTEPCSAPGLLSTDAPNILTIGDSISMCGFGYGHFVHDMLVKQSNGTLAGYSSACGQMARL